MHISKIDIEGYKTFSDKFSINISKGLCVILGENACGKSTIIDAIRLILQEDEYGQSGIVASDFHRPFSQDSVASEKILIQCEFSGLNSLQQTAYLPWLRSNDVSSALLSLQVENKLNRRGYYKREIWCGESTASVFEKDLLDRINCVYLPPLRDAEQRLKAIKGSRLARLFRNLNKQDIDSGTVLPLEKKVREFNRSLAIDESAGIVEVNELIKTQLRKALGTIYGQDTTIQFSESSFLRIVEHLRVLYYPTIPMSDKNAVSQFRDLSENSLGYNNLIYLATILAEFEGLSDSSDQDLKVLLIEEPEAHLHPQLQQRLMSYFAHVTDSNDRMQVIVTTHSPTIASHVNLDVISIVKRDSVAKNPLSVSLKDCITDTKSKQYLRRWLDITKSTLFFSKGVILVEGISEALIIPELAKIYLNQKKTDNTRDLSTYGITIVVVGGISFKHFFQLFSNVTLDGQSKTKACLMIRCSALSDRDPDRYENTATDENSSC